GVGVYKHLNVAEVAQALIYVDEDALNQHHRPRGNVDRLRTASIGGEIVDGTLHWLTPDQAADVVQQQVHLDGVWRVPVDALALWFGEMYIFTIIRIFGEDSHAFGTHGPHDGPRDGSLASSGSSCHADDEPIPFFLCFHRLSLALWGQQQVGTSCTAARM